MRTLLLLMALFGALLASEKRILILSTSPVLEAKFTHLAKSAANQGLLLEGYLVEALPKAPLDPDAYDLVILDTPGSHNVKSVREATAGFLAAYRGALLQTGREGFKAQKMDDTVAKTLHEYYFNGTARNEVPMFAYMRKHLWHEALDEPAPPFVFGKVGIYHPDYDGVIFESRAEYFKWRGVGTDDSRPVIAIALHKNYVASGTTAHVDALIRGLEKRGALVLPFFDSVVDPTGIASMLLDGDRCVADVLISLQIVLSPEGRKTSFEKLGIPVIHTLLYREGDRAAWESDRVGLAAGSVPFFLANAEYAGMIDSMSIAVVDASGMPQPLQEQVDSVISKALSYAVLRHKSNRDKKVALMFYNYPTKESGISASFMNAPASIEAILGAMKAADYNVTALNEAQLLEKLQRLLQGLHREGAAQELPGENLAGMLPMTHYKQWFETLPEAVQQRINARWGTPESDPMATPEGFIIPRLSAGNMLIMPQPPRGSRNEAKENAIYHDMSVPVNHFYLAAYMYVRETFKADALIHLGTHGSQEWTFGKERGLSVYDDPFLTLGDIPVIYPYIVDNIGEATQTKRRGRAVNITHMTPPFGASGLYRELNDIHTLIHEYQSADEGEVRRQIKLKILSQCETQELIWNDLGYTKEAADADFETFSAKLHNHLHALAATSRPMGLHTFGHAAPKDQRIHTVMQMLGEELLKAVDPKEWDEALTIDFAELNQSKAFKAVTAYLEGNATDTMALMAREYERNLRETLEMPRLLEALEGKHIPTKYGGDPIRSPETLPTGFNHYGFDPSRVPTQSAWEAGKIALNQLIDAHKAKHGETPKKLAFTMWSVETMRHFGILEAQVLYALGVEPVWDRGGRVSGVKLIDEKSLGRARIDTVISATGLYRDQFPNAMLRMNEAVALVSDLNDSNPVAMNTRESFEALIAKGVDAAKAKVFSKVRVFSNESGVYGSNLEDAALASDTWENEEKLANLYLNRMQYAFGEGLASSGEKADAMNLYAQNLKNVDGAVLSRSSNLYGMLTTDDPFQYLGGLSLAVRHVSGKSPELYISNLRDARKTKVDGAAEFMATELSTRQFHPGYIQDLMAEGHAGALSMTGSLENFWGWQVMDKSVVRDDQWKAFHDIYVKDKYDLKLREWLEKTDPEALTQMVDRMLEAVRKEYWKADEATLKSLLEAYNALHVSHDLPPLHEKLDEFAKAQSAGFGLGAALAGSTRVEGMKLEQKNPEESAQHDTPLPLYLMLLLALIALGMAIETLHVRKGRL